MKKILKLLSAASAAMLFAYTGAHSQEIHYPDEVKYLFNSADESESVSRETAPLVAVPQCTAAERLCGEILRSGGAPVIVPQTTDGAVLRDMSSRWDGVAFPQNWVRENDAFSVLFYKAVTDMNVPCFGSSPLTMRIDAGLMRRPEAIVSVGDLVRKASYYRKAKEVMGRIFSIDLHGDLPCRYDEGYSIGERADNQISIQKMDEGHLDSRVLISYIGQNHFDGNRPEEAFRYCDSILDQIEGDVKKNSSRAGIVRTGAEARALKRDGKKAFFLGIENGYGIGEDISNVDHFADRGVVYITLSHLYDNAICHTSSSHSADTTLGLTPFGEKVVERMNRRGILVDVSHTSSGTFWDCIRLSKAPIICSHSGAKAVFDHNRNITDDQLRALRDNGGVIQVYIVPDYMDTDYDKVSIDYFFAHLLHCIEVAGIDHVGIACDFDGGGGGWGLNGDNDLINITTRLVELGFSPEDLEKLWGGNFLRVLDEAQRIAVELSAE